MLVVLDLDETLIHATQIPLAVDYDFQFADYFIYKRPYLNWFLETIHSVFDLAIWSSADDRYVQGITELALPAELNFKFIWGRSHYTLRRDLDRDEYIYVKRLKKVKRFSYRLEEVLMVDDSPEKSRDNYGNAIYISPFQGDALDMELKQLAQYLLTIKDKENVRKIDKRNWRTACLD